jgi:hypothetical protein
MQPPGVEKTMSQDLRHLHRDQMLSLSAPLRVQSEQGVLWVTVDGEPEDILLAPGESVHIASRARVIVHALGDAATTRLWHLATEGEPRWRRLLHALLPARAALRRPDALARLA